VVGTPEDYARELIAAGCAVNAWETTYLQLMPAADRADGQAPVHPVLTWLEGTALRPVRGALDDAAWVEFREELGVELAAAYPVQDGLVYFPFQRVFVIASVSKE
jgi:trans-aconitate 2-methyltransferase